MELEGFEQRLAETVDWCELEMIANDARMTTTGSLFFQKLNSLFDGNAVAESCRVIKENAHVKGAILRRFTPEVMGRVYPNKLLSLQDSELEQEIEQVSRQRSVALAQHKHNVTGSTSLRMGRLLYFAPGLSIFDGAAMVVSGGFFDEETFPPSDTWIAYLKEKTDHKGHPPGYLLSWVPEQVINLVEDAIVVDPTESIRWAASVNTPFLDLLRQQNPKLAGV